MAQAVYVCILWMATGSQLSAANYWRIFSLVWSRRHRIVRNTYREEDKSWRERHLIVCATRGRPVYPVLLLLSNLQLTGYVPGHLSAVAGLRAGIDFVPPEPWLACLWRFSCQIAIIQSGFQVSPFSQLITRPPLLLAASIIAGPPRRPQPCCTHGVSSMLSLLLAASIIAGPPRRPQPCCTHGVSSMLWLPLAQPWGKHVSSGVYLTLARLLDHIENYMYHILWIDCSVVCLGGRLRIILCGNVIN